MEPNHSMHIITHNFIHCIQMYYQVINVLQQIQVETNTKCNAINKNIWNISRKVTLEKQEYLKTCRDKYMSSEIKVLAYIQRMGVTFPGKEI